MGVRYSYKCEKCKNEEIVVHSIKEDPVIKCSKCNNTMFRKVTGFITRWKCEGETR